MDSMNFKCENSKFDIALIKPYFKDGADFYYDGKQVILIPTTTKPIKIILESKPTSELETLEKFLDAINKF